MQLSMGQIINSNYIKYDRLDEIVKNAFVGSTSVKVNIFIDINSCIKTIFSSIFDNTSLEEYTEMSSHFINMISHYRKFFRRRYRVESAFYLVYSSNISENNQIFYPDYNVKMINNLKMNPEKLDMVMKNLNILEQICPYLPDVSFTAGTFETSVIMHHIINKIREENVPNIIISRDIFSTQLVSVNDDVIIFRPKKSQTDESYFIGKNGCINNLILNRQVSASTDGLNDGLLSFIMALNKMPERGIKTLMSLPKTLSSIKYAIDNGRVYNGYNSYISNIYELFPNKEKIQAIHGGIDSRFKAIDIIYQYGIYLNNPERHNFTGIQNLYSPNSLHEICNEFFKKNPLDLENL